MNKYFISLYLLSKYKVKDFIFIVILLVRFVIDFTNGWGCWGDPTTKGSKHNGL